MAALWKFHCLEHPTQYRFMLQAAQCSVDLTDLPRTLEMIIQIRDREFRGREFILSLMHVLTLTPLFHSSPVALTPKPCCHEKKLHTSQKGEQSVFLLNSSEICMVACFSPLQTESCQPSTEGIVDISEINLTACV